MRTEFLIVSNYAVLNKDGFDDLKTYIHLAKCLICKDTRIDTIGKPYRTEYIKEKEFMRLIHLHNGIEVQSSEENLDLLAINLRKSEKLPEEIKKLGYLAKEDIIEVVV